MANYRVYCLDRQGKITSAEWIEAKDDATAEQATRALGKASRCELWLGNRMVTAIEPAA